MHAAAIALDGKVVCWGDNRYSQCDVPAELEYEQVVAVSCGSYHSAVIVGNLLEALVDVNAYVYLSISSTN
jgi:glucosamine 6-phosphate synthetase-like amidotransferase/phosphosugar isomerase protein